MWLLLFDFCAHVRIRCTLIEGFAAAAGFWPRLLNILKLAALIVNMVVETLGEGLLSFCLLVLADKAKVKPNQNRAIEPLPPGLG